MIKQILDFLGQWTIPPGLTGCEWALRLLAGFGLCALLILIMALIQAWIIVKYNLDD